MGIRFADFKRICVAALLVSLPVAVHAAASEKSKSKGPALISPTRPRDSRGETVYEIQSPDNESEPIVPGVFILPHPTKLADFKPPRHRKGPIRAEDVTIEGVVAQNGDFIDPMVIDTVDPEFAKSALDALARSQFAPGTLDGKPVAVLARIVIQIRPQ